MAKPKSARYTIRTIKQLVYFHTSKKKREEEEEDNTTRATEVLVDRKSSPNLMHNKFF